MPGGIIMLCCIPDDDDDGGPPRPEERSKCPDAVDDEEMVTDCPLERFTVSLTGPHALHCGSLHLR